MLDIRAWLLSPVFETLNQLIGTIMTTTAETVASIEALTAQVVKIRTETVAELQKLRDQISSGSMTPTEVVAALDALKSELQTSDDVIPDASPVEPPAPTE